jgi:hypothetical protein
MSTSGTNKKKKMSIEKFTPEQLQVLLPTSYILNKPISESITLYVGNTRFVLKNEQTDAQQLVKYIESIINSAMGYIIQYDANLDTNVCEIILQMIMAIMRYNKTSKMLGSVIQFKRIRASLMLPECVFYSDKIFYFNMPLIGNVLYQATRNRISLEFAEGLNEPTKNVKLFDISSTSIIKDSSYTDRLLQLLIIADHMCTHLFDGKTTDYCNHIKFGLVGYTLHSKLLIKSKGNSSNLLMFDNDAFSGAC